MDQAEVIELARRSAEPAVTILMPVELPLAVHPEDSLRLRASIDRALGLVESWWGADAARGVAAQLEGLALEVGEHGHGLAVLATPQDRQVLHLPFTVEEQVVVDRSFATRQLLEGVARSPRCRVLVLAGRHARLLEGRGGHLEEVESEGFPLQLEPPHEWDTPHRDLPIHEDLATEEDRFVQRAVDEALGAAAERAELPLVVMAPERELARFEEVSRHGGSIVGTAHWAFGSASPAEVAVAAAPVVDQWLAARRREAANRLREAYGRHRAVVGLADVQHAAHEGRGHELLVEEGFTLPRHFVDGLSAGDEPDVELEMDDMVDDVIETVLLAGGGVEFVEDGALDAEGRIGLILRGTV